MNEDTAAGFAAAEEFVSAGGRARALIADGRMAAKDVQQVRVAARRALAESIRRLGDDQAAQPVTDAEQGGARAWAAGRKLTIDILRKQLKAQRDRCVALSVANEANPALRYAEQAIAEARLGSTVEMAELLLAPEDYGLLMETLGLRPHFGR